MLNKKYLKSKTYLRHLLEMCKCAGVRNVKCYTNGQIKSPFLLKPA